MKHVLNLSLSILLFLNFSINKANAVRVAPPGPGPAEGLASTTYLPMIRDKFPHFLDQLAYINYKIGGGKDIYLINDDGSQEVNLTSLATNIYNLQWSPDGTMIAFGSDFQEEENTDVYIIDVQTLQISRLTTNPKTDGFPSWSPDSQQLVYESWREGSPKIFKYDLETGVETQLTARDRESTQPFWAPNGSKIAYHDGSCSQVDCNEIEIYSMNPDGSGKLNLTNNDFQDYFQAWSPDSTKILLLSNRYMEGVPGKSDVVLMNADGTGVDFFTLGGKAQFAAWSPSGNRIVISTFPPETTWIANIDRSGFQTLSCLDIPFTAFYPAWSPDGTRIAFSSIIVGAGFSSGIYILTLEGLSCTHTIPGEATRALWRPRK